MSKCIKGKGQIKYVVNEENRTVVAILENGRREALNYMAAPANRYFKGQLSVFPGYFSDDSMIINQAVEDCVNPKYIGIAKCAPEDEFDEKVGMSIARARCLTKYYCDLWTAFIRARFLYHQLENVLNDRQIKVYESYIHWLKESEQPEILDL